jgi:ATP-dependent DNA helicase RecG
MEKQNIEWKSMWKDEYLKWVCAFANTQGGELHIGRDNTGKVAVLDRADELLDVIPKKIRNSMGIVCEVNLTDEGYILITVNHYPHPISYHGRYYIRSGSTTQELTGNALDEFLLRAHGKTWDAVPVPHVGAKDLDIVAFREFRKKALARDRLTAEDLDITDEQLVSTLRLTENKYLKRAALLCFHEEPDKWVTGVHVKIGYFKTDDDLVFQDEISGPLITMPDKVMDLLYSKYFKGIISYEGIQRVETYPVHRESMREAILNAIVHKDYASGNPIQIRVYDNKITVFNSGILPADWSVEKLLASRTSAPHNPDIARVFFRSGMTEAWGRGIEKIINSNVNAGKPKPEFEMVGNGLIVSFYGDANITANITLNETQKKLLALMVSNPQVTIKELSERIGISERNIKSNIKTLKNEGRVERIGASKNGSWITK